MKHKIITILGILALASCQSNLLIDMARTEKEMSLNVLAPKTRANSASTAFEASERMGLYVVDYKNDTTPMPLQISGNRANNMALNYSGSAWTTQSTLYWGEGKSDVYAYYPYMENISDVNAQPLSVAYDQSESIESSDFLWAKAEAVNSSTGITLAMNHLMSKLTVKLVAGPSYIGSLPDDATIYLHSTVADALVDLESGSVTKAPYSGNKSIKMHKLGVKTVDGVDAVVYEAIVVPQMINSSVPLFEINSKSVSYLIEDSFNFRPGTAYGYTITLNASTTAIQVEIGCEIEDWNGTGGNTGGSESGNESGTNPGDDDTKTYTDLSTNGTANCYLISGTGDYKFPATIGNTTASVGNVKSVEVLWESFGSDVMPNVGDLIASVSYKDGYVRFSTPETFKNGNALIAVKNSKGVILWSWHIWCSGEGWVDQVYYNNAGTMMDRNLGAISAAPGDVGALGLLYQWGRKDPFLGSSSIRFNRTAASTLTWPSAVASNASVGTIPYAQEHPTTFISYNTDWYYSGPFCTENTRWQSTKTIYDPCPAGYRVPDGGNSGIWSKASGTSKYIHISDLYDSAKEGMNLSGKFGSDSSIWYPPAGYLSCSSGQLYNTGAQGNYWSVTPDSEIYSNYACDLCITSDGYVYPAYNNNNRASALSVRCCKE